MADLKGIKPGSWCSAYHKSKDRAICADRRCMYYQNHVVTVSDHPSENDSVPNIDDNLDAVGIKSPVIRAPRVNYQIGAETGWHCILYDEPSKLRTLPWE